MIGHTWPHPPSRAITRRRTQCPGAGTSQDLEDWYIIVGPRRTVLDDVNVILLQHTPNLLNILLVHAGDANAAVDIAITMLNNFEIKRDTVQPKNDLPAR